MKSMLKYDLLGFQTNRDVDNFLACLRTHFGLESKDGVVTTERCQTRLQKFPIGIDPEQFARILRQTSLPQSKKKSRHYCKNFRAPSLPSA
ncbi:trehalose-6-phosphate synthase [Bradyrhizobium sp. IC4061]|uniref:trehalose-6-phosphate synthase n=1 Tax=unclassified Bradyrhizobium TaxID=2631580 RepID=UPI0032094108